MKLVFALEFLLLQDATNYSHNNNRCYAQTFFHTIDMNHTCCFAEDGMHTF